LTPNELVLTFGGLHLCVKFGENRQRNATVRMMTHGQTDRHTDTQTDRQTQTDFINCPIAICYSYGADNKQEKKRTEHLTTFFESSEQSVQQNALQLAVGRFALFLVLPGRTGT